MFNPQASGFFPKRWALQQPTHRYPSEIRDTSSATAEPSSTDAKRLATDPYLQLPEGIRGAISRKEYLWMTDSQKAGLIDAETEPDF